MKSVIIIPLTVAGCVGMVAIVLSAAGVHINAVYPLTAAVIGAVSGSIGLVPLLRTGQKDPASVAQMALVGTVLHLLCTAFMANALIVSHLMNTGGTFVFWLLGAYWISLAVLVWQLRRVLLEKTDTLKVQHSS